MLYIKVHNHFAADPSRAALHDEYMKGKSNDILFLVRGITRPILDEKLATSTGKETDEAAATYNNVLSGRLLKPSEAEKMINVLGYDGRETLHVLSGQGSKFLRTNSTNCSIYMRMKIEMRMTLNMKMETRMNGKRR